MEISKLFKNIEKDMNLLEERVKRRQEEYKQKLKELSRLYKCNLNDETIKNFLRRPYVLIPKKRDEWYCVVPKFVDFQVGWLDHSTDSFNIYIINKYTQWFSQIPIGLREEINFREPENISVTDGVLSFSDGNEDNIRLKYGKFLTSVGKGRARIKRGKEFDLIAEIIDNGSLPFIPQAISEKDLREPNVDFSLSGKFSFQMDAYKKFLEYGACGIYWMTGAGKSFFTMYALDTLKGKKLIVVPTRTLIDMWKNEYLKKYAPRLLDETTICTYQAFHKIKNKEFICAVFDECQFLPANTFSKFSTIKAKYRIGLSATPFREDGRTNYIIALTGFPIGLDWKIIMDILGKTFHEVNVYVLKNMKEKIRRIIDLVDFDKKTVIFSDSISFGQKISKKLNVPFVYSRTKNRIDIIKNNKVLVVSRVADLGISIKDLEHVIEADFLFGSRRQEVQRTGRLMHSLSKTRKKHDILMTEEEFYNYRKRLHGLIEKGFKINMQVFTGKSLKFTNPIKTKVKKHKKKYREYKIKEENKEIIKGFVKRKIDQYIKIINGLTPKQRKILRFLIIARRERIGKTESALGFKIRDEIKLLQDTNLVRIDGHGLNYNIKRKIETELSQFKASSEDKKIAVNKIENIIKNWNE